MCTSVNCCFVPQNLVTSSIALRVSRQKWNCIMQTATRQNILRWEPYVYKRAQCALHMETRSGTAYFIWPQGETFSYCHWKQYVYKRAHGNQTAHVFENIDHLTQLSVTSISARARTVAAILISNVGTNAQVPYS